MPIEKFEEIPAYLETNKDNEAVIKFINSFNPLSEVKEDKVGDFVNKTPILKSFYDKRTTQGIETFKENNLEKIKADVIDEYVKKNYPEESEEQKRIKALELKGAENEKRIKQGDILAVGIEYATANDIPISLVKLVSGDSHELTETNLNKTKEIILKREKSAVEAFIKNHGRKPADGDITVNSLQKKLSEALKAGDQKTALKIKREIYEKNKKE